MAIKKERRLCEADCGRRVARPLARYRFCSLKCQQRHEHNLRVTAYLEGRYAVPGRNHAAFLRRYLIEKLGQRCARCGWAAIHPATGKIPLQVDHIDGNRQNNRPENLTLLCPNCHALTPTYKHLNSHRSRR